MNTFDTAAYIAQIGAIMREHTEREFAKAAEAQAVKAAVAERTRAYMEDLNRQMAEQAYAVL